MSKHFWRGFWDGMNPAFWLAMLCYWAGDLVSRVMTWADWLGHLYPVYNTLMNWSVRIQDRCGLNGPWGKAQEEQGGGKL